MGQSVLTLRDVHKRFGAKQVLAGANLDLPAGSVWGLVGLNGAGKTTLIRVLLGLLKADKGECRVLGCDPWRHQSALYARVGVVLEHSGFWGNLTVEENVRFFGSARGLSPAAATEYLRNHWSSADILHTRQKVKFLSRGEKMQCALCRAFLGWPEVLLLDEPVVALDMRAYDHFCGLVRLAREKGGAVLISSHQFDAIAQLCDTVAILEDGAISVLDQCAEPGERWRVKAPAQPEFAAAIRETLGVDPRYDGGAWHMRIRDPASAVPALVARLVSLGCPIQEVLREERDVRSSIREHFDGAYARRKGG